MTNLRIPGPIPVPGPILEEMGRPMINHRGPEFRDILLRVTERLRQVYATQGDVYVLSSSGTGAMEAAIVNTLSPGDRVLAVTGGAFGDRFARIAEVFGADVTVLRYPLGQPADPDGVRDSLNSDPTVKAVLVTHNETSTGVANDLASIASVVKGEFGKLLLVDGVSSVGSVPMFTDEWGCDVVASASQKGWMVPPGLAFVNFSADAWRAHAEASMPRYYFDAAEYKRYLEIGQPPWTPAISVFFALDRALGAMLDEGLSEVHARHARAAERVRQGVADLGLSLLPHPDHASDTITAVRVPEGINAAELLRVMRDEYDVVLAGGQQSLAGKIFRIGHLGMVSDEDIDGVLAALGATLQKLRYSGASS
ncbi:MAG: alanine--glyoxylate aminotransferase family protein [Dehalococcoidia bacterium]|nr:alanine--glyoxylate aminotransferase family protein [Dehalococcoidia bacterium]